MTALTWARPIVDMPVCVKYHKGMNSDVLRHIVEDAIEAKRYHALISADELERFRAQLRALEEYTEEKCAKKAQAEKDDVLRDYARFEAARMQRIASLDAQLCTLAELNVPPQYSELRAAYDAQVEALRKARYVLETQDNPHDVDDEEDGEEWRARTRNQLLQLIALGEEEMRKQQEAAVYATVLRDQLEATLDDSLGRHAGKHPACAEE